jgi:hypothetical protein
MSHFRAELTITLKDGRTLTECFNQLEMAHFTRERMLGRLRKGLPLVIYDADRIEIPAGQVLSVHVVEHDLVEA